MSSIRLQSLSIPLSTLKEGESSFFFETEFPDSRVGDACSFPEKVAVEARVVSMTDEYLIDLRVESLGRFVCDRCDEDFQKKITGTIRVLFTFDWSKEEGEGGDVRLLSPTTQEIDISQDVRDALLLAVPQKRLCKEECKGLCSRCGVNLNDALCTCERDDTDPRWEALKGLSLDE